jgi:hypothetical protein
VLLADGDEPERDGDLAHGVGGDRPAAVAEPAQRPAGGREWHEQQRAERHARPGDERGRDVGVDGHPDEEVRDPPDHRDGGEEEPGASGHGPGIF